MDPTEFRRLGHELIEWIADYRERIADYPGEAGGGDPRRPTRSQAGRLPPAADEPQDNRMIDDERSRL